MFTRLWLGLNSMRCADIAVRSPPTSDSRHSVAVLRPSPNRMYKPFDWSKLTDLKVTAAKTQFDFWVGFDF